MPEKEEIICMTAEQWREHDIQTARAEARSRQVKWNQKHEEERERRTYFVKQKMLGIVIATASLIPFVIFKDIVSLVFFVPAIAMGIVMAASDKMFIMNEYYWTHGGADQWEEEDDEWD